MEAGYPVFVVRVSRDGHWILSGSRVGKVNVWDARGHQKVVEAEGYNDTVAAIDILPDSMSLWRDQATAPRSLGSSELTILKSCWRVGITSSYFHRVSLSNFRIP